MASSDGSPTQGALSNIRQLLPKFEAILTQIKASSSAKAEFAPILADQSHSADSVLDQLQACLAAAVNNPQEELDERLRSISVDLNAVLQALGGEHGLVSESEQQSFPVIDSVERKVALVSQFAVAKVRPAPHKAAKVDGGEETIISQQLRFKIAQQQLRVDAHREQIALADISSRQLNATMDRLVTSNKEKDRKIREKDNEIKKNTVTIVALGGQIKDLTRQSSVIQQENQLLQKKLDDFDKAHRELQAKINALEGALQENSNTKTHLETGTSQLQSSLKSLEETNKLLTESVERLEKERSELTTRCEEAELSNTKNSESLELVTREKAALDEKSQNLAKENADLIQFKIHSVSGAQKEKNRLEGIIRCYSVLVGKKKAAIETLETTFICQIEDLKTQIEILQAKIEIQNKEQEEAKQTQADLQAKIQSMSQARYKLLATQKELSGKYIAAEGNNQRLTAELEAAKSELATHKSTLSLTTEEKNSLKTVVDSMQSQMKSLSDERQRLEVGLTEEQHYRLQTKAALQEMAILDKENLELKQKNKELERQLVNFRLTQPVVGFNQPKSGTATPTKSVTPGGISSPDQRSHSIDTSNQEIQHLTKLAAVQKEMIRQLEEQLRKQDESIREFTFNTDKSMDGDREELIRQLEEQLRRCDETIRDMTHNTERSIETERGTLIKEMEEQVRKRDQTIKELTEKVGLKGQRTALRQVLQRLAAAFYSQRRVDKAIVFENWRLELVGPAVQVPDSILELIPDTLTFAEETWDDETLQSFVDMHTFLDEEWRSQMRCALLKIQPKLLPPKSCVPATSSDSALFWNNVLKLKFIEDSKDLEEGYMPVKLMDFLLLHLEDNSILDQRKLTHQLSGLYEAFHRHESFAALISRLLQILDTSPASQEAQIVVVQYSHEFDELLEQVNGPEATITLTSTVTLAVLLDNYFDVLEMQDYIGQHWFRYFRPINVSMRDFVVFVIYWKLARDKKRPDDLWKLARGTRQLADEQLEGVLHQMGIMASPGVVDEASPITKQFYQSKANILDSADYFLVKKADFLIGVLEACLAKVRRAALAAHHLFQEIGTPICTREQFSEWMSESSASPECIVKMFDEGLTLSSTTDGLDTGAFVRILSRRILGSAGEPPLSEARFRELFEPRIPAK